MLLHSLKDIKLFVVIEGHLKGRLIYNSKITISKNFYFEIPKDIQG
jgi:hypothetical protein